MEGCITEPKRARGKANRRGFCFAGAIKKKNKKKKNLTSIFSQDKLPFVVAAQRKVWHRLIQDPARLWNFKWELVAYTYWVRTPKPPPSPQPTPIGVWRISSAECSQIEWVENIKVQYRCTSDLLLSLWVTLLGDWHSPKFVIDSSLRTYIVVLSLVRAWRQQTPEQVQTRPLWPPFWLDLLDSNIFANNWWQNKYMYVCTYNTHACLWASPLFLRERIPESRRRYIC